MTEESVVELSMRTDKKLPNLKVPVKGKRGTSRYSRTKSMFSKPAKQPARAIISPNLYANKLTSFKDLVVTPDALPGADDETKYRDQKRKRMMKRSYESTEVNEEEVVEIVCPDGEVIEQLSIAGRRKLSRTMKRRKSQLKRARARARKRMATRGVLKKRARRSARAQLAKRFTKGKTDLSVAQKKSVERRLKNPAIQRRIATLTKRTMPKKRKQEILRKR